MSTGEIISIIAVCLSFLGVLSSFLFSYKKANKEAENERELNVIKITNIQNNITNICDDLQTINRKLDKIDNDHDKIINHESRIINLEKEVFKKGA